MEWIREVIRLDREHAARRAARLAHEARILDRDEMWMREIGRPGIERFAAHMRMMGLETRVEDSPGACRVEVGPAEAPGFAAVVSPAGGGMRIGTVSGRLTQEVFRCGKSEEAVYARLKVKFLRSLWVEDEWFSAEPAD